MPNPGCKEDAEEVRSPVVALSLLSLLLYEDVHCLDAVGLFWTAFLFFSCKLQFKFISQHCTVISTVHCLPMRLEMHQNRSTHVPKERQRDFLGGRLSFEFLLHWRGEMHPFHALFFALRIIVMHPCLVTGKFFRGYSDLLHAI